MRKKTSKPEAETEQVVSLIIEHIGQKKLQPGDTIPSVRELSKQWKIGRNVVRDGLLLSQAFGIVNIKARSGVTVGRADSRALMDAISTTFLFNLRQHDPTLAYLWDARRIIETENCANAARRRLPEDLMNLKKIINQMEALPEKDREHFIQLDNDFHLEISRVAGNPVLSTILKSLLEILRLERLNIHPNKARLEKTHEMHRMIYQAIADGDSQAAAAAAAVHMGRYVKLLTGLNPAEPKGSSKSSPASGRKDGDSSD